MAVGNLTLYGCPMCPEHARALSPVTWDIVLNGEHSTFAIGCCPVDAALCDIFPTLKRALFQSQAAQEMLRRLVQ